MTQKNLADNNLQYSFSFWLKITVSGFCGEKVTSKNVLVLLPFLPGAKGRKYFFCFNNSVKHFWSNFFTTKTWDCIILSQNEKQYRRLFCAKHSSLLSMFFKISKANIHANCKFELWEEEYFLRIFFYLKILRKGILNDQQMTHCGNSRKFKTFNLNVKKYFCSNENAI